MKDLRRLVNPGLERALEELEAVPELHCFQMRMRSATRGGRIAATKLLVEDAIASVALTSAEYADSLKALLALGPATESATARRSNAGNCIGKSGPTFTRHHEKNVLSVLCDALVTLDDTEAQEDGAPRVAFIDVGWTQIQQTLSSMHRDIERSFAPDAILTMSGPGSFAAYLVLSMNTRDVPVIAATTFPARDRPSHAQQLFELASEDATWKILRTSKWTVFLPSSLPRYPSQSRVLIFDDRVISGDTQRLARAELESAGLVVNTAAMIVSSKNKQLVDFSGLVIDDNYAMPWGTRRGRT